MNKRFRRAVLFIGIVAFSTLGYCFFIKGDLQRVIEAAERSSSYLRLREEVEEKNIDGEVHLDHIIEGMNNILSCVSIQDSSVEVLSEGGRKYGFIVGGKIYRGEVIEIMKKIRGFNEQWSIEEVVLRFHEENIDLSMKFVARG